VFYARKGNTDLFLSEITVQFLAFHAQHTEDDAHLMCKPLTPKEDYDVVFESSLAKRHKKSRPFRFLPRSDTNELLYEALSSASLWVDKKPYGFVKRHLNELVDRVCHGSGEQHRLS
jgi:hypothetical protein